MRFFITEREIKSGKRACAEDCPIALAVQKKNPHWSTVRVGRQGISYVFDYNTYYGHFTYSTKEWVKRFDNGENVEPFHFNIHFEQSGRRKI